MVYMDVSISGLELQYEQYYLAHDLNSNINILYIFINVLGVDKKHISKHISFVMFIDCLMKCAAFYQNP